MKPTLLKLLCILIDAMPDIEGADGHAETNREQLEARKLLRKLEEELADE